MFFFPYQERYESQLEYIEFRRHQLRNHQEGGNPSMENQMTTLQDKYGQFRKRDGSLNTRQVFQMLKSEERKQVKVNKKRPAFLNYYI